MLMDEQEIVQENQRLEQQLTALQEELRHSKKDIKYKIGLTVGENLRPRKRIFRIPKQLKELNRQHGQETALRAPIEDPLAYQKSLKEQIMEATFYADRDASDILYAIGEELYHAQNSIGRKLLLPIRLWKIRRNNRNMYCSPSVSLPPIEGIRESILFIATNGAGLGHLTRCLAVARRLRKRCPELEIIFLTTSLALTTIHREGFTAYCIPSKMLIRKISPGQWSALLRTMMSELLQLYRFSAVVFDGAMPYAAITSAMAKEKQIPRIWIRRGSEKSAEIAENRNDAEKDFDYIIIPGEAGAPIKENDGRHFYVNPIIYIDKEELWARDDVRKYLKIPDGKKAVYVQMGAGNINDIHSDIYKIITALRKYPDIMIVLGESIIGDELKIIEDDIVVIKDYPNSKYLRGFDFAISACGYNSFHELLFLEVPTIFIPNMNTQADDQYARALIAQNQGVGIVVTDICGEQLPQAISHLHSIGESFEMHTGRMQIVQENGADKAAEYIVECFKKRE